MSHDGNSQDTTHKEHSLSFIITPYLELFITPYSEWLNRWHKVIPAQCCSRKKSIIASYQMFSKARKVFPSLLIKPRSPLCGKRTDKTSSWLYSYFHMSDQRQCPHFKGHDLFARGLLLTCFHISRNSPFLYKQNFFCKHSNNCSSFSRKRTGMIKNQIPQF